MTTETTIKRSVTTDGWFMAAYNALADRTRWPGLTWFKCEQDETHGHYRIDECGLTPIEPLTHFKYALETMFDDEPCHADGCDSFDRVGWRFVGYQRKAVEWTCAEHRAGEWHAWP